MNGPQHYAEAERLLQLAMLTDDSVEAGYMGEIAAAQVHATLALAAATALPLANPSDFDLQRAGWASATETAVSQ